jgi:hypothetical protein
MSLPLPKMAKPCILRVIIISTGKSKRQQTSNIIKTLQATNENGKWVNVQELPFSNEYSVAHPAECRRENLVFCIRHARYHYDLLK